MRHCSKVISSDCRGRIDAGAVHEDVAAAELPFHRLPEFGDLGLRGLIAANGDRGAARLFLSRRRFLGVGDVGNDEYAACAASRLQKACPMPLAPPVMTARFPVDMLAFSRFA